eukprot:3408185-Pleurochrysis_carterae.AAC.1
MVAPVRESLPECTSTRASVCVDTSTRAGPRLLRERYAGGADRDGRALAEQHEEEQRRNVDLRGDKTARVHATSRAYSASRAPRPSAQRASSDRLPGLGRAPRGGC